MTGEKWVDLHASDDETYFRRLRRDFFVAGLSRSIVELQGQAEMIVDGLACPDPAQWS